jgi:DNA-binding winged helix-turn-helix (wHTH) protein/TolB-like protein/Flp pilus assembly protein TadD
VPAHNFTPGATASPQLEIGDWRADSTTNELSRAGETRRMEPKAMEVLMLLAAGNGKVVSREELFAAVWPGLVVSDEALTQCIIKLRKALGDSPRSPAYIETISKRGYRLIAPVRASEPASPARRTDTGAPPGRMSRRLRPTGLAIGASVLLAIVMAMTAWVVERWVTPRSVETDRPAGDPQATSITVAVLPFESLGSDDAQAYLARGIRNDLMTELGRLGGLRLIRAGSAAPAGSGDRGARYVVTGSVQRASEMLRINIQVIDTGTNHQLWSERFERPFADLFAVQDEIIHRLTALLPGTLSDATRQRVAGRYTRSLEAYDCFLRAQALFLVRQSAENEEARGLYRKALELDPEFARAYSGLAMTYAMDHVLGTSRDAASGLGRAFELAETARTIDPDIPEVHWALGFVRAQSRRHAEALQSLRRAIELNRSFADAYAFMGGIYTYVGEPAKSIPLLRTAMRLNPDGGSLYFLLLGRAYLFENDIEQALLNLRQAAARNPANLETRIYLAAALAAAEDLAGAEWEAAEIRAREGGFSRVDWLDSYPMTSAVHRTMLVRLLAKVGL